ncbi:hypothetical protein NE235_18405 [Actinoallomurus spadix]|uniref:Ankyrin repeat domain-containing protein n=1 Tax=Actinoallomurus spadix TaxID=79912 RepID=A0ABP3FPC0_9ACTN|nr:hypothetical protein [Actinoallomurus spadix]MCO5988077.1 hypothetical protein [Actinoallomurus spadix]
MVTGTPGPRAAGRRPSRPESYPPDEAGSLRRIRRYAVPRWMIEQATERRLAGDWRGACAAANVDVAFDLAGIARDHGAAVAAELEAPGPVRVRCRGEWHVVGFRDGALQVPHGEDERRRERALGALGGAINGCSAVLPIVRSGTGRLPRALREQRRELFLRAERGDTPGVIRLLAGGARIDASDRWGRSARDHITQRRRADLEFVLRGPDHDRPDAGGDHPR